MADYHFFVTNGEKQRVNQTARSHSMRTALQVRSNGLPARVYLPSQISQKTIKSKKTLKGRFRLGVEKRRVKSDEKSGPTKNTGIDLIADRSATKYSPAAPHSREQDRETIVHSPAGFDVYYVALHYNEQTDALFTNCLTHFQRDVKVSNHEKTHFSFSMTDPLIMASVLAMTGIYCALDGTLTDASVEFEAWRQKGKVIEKINYHLQSNQVQITDSVIVSLATLISIMNMNGVFHMADVHLNGLAEMIYARGGLSAFQHNPHLSRVVTWADIQTASGLGRAPKFPLFARPWESSVLSNSLIEAESESLKPLRGIDGAAEALNVLTMLRRVISLQNDAYIKSIGSAATTDELTDAAEHMILRHIAEHPSRQSSSAVVHATFSAAHVFIYCYLRDIPKRAKIFQILLFRLQQSLLSMDDLTLGRNDRWPIIWALFIGYAAGLRMDENQNTYKEWFLLKLHTALDVMKQYGELDKDLVKKHMMEFPWVDRLCQVAYAHV
ncbi:hypothetical protein BP6252_11372 [Coleophoma cylindrospora]|uniref:Transcription factor domain-containing protein n=1 Tax=Coleophoma cylindrospora TaxID=1849047 RepID=A0A3D8QJH9_9HELO|nr:hypothetical protein BP6252_11372 [Coleophoma cylindrospora]